MERDLIELSYALETFGGLSHGRIVECFPLYTDRGGSPIIGALAEERMFENRRGGHDMVKPMADIDNERRPGARPAGAH